MTASLPPAIKVPVDKAIETMENIYNRANSIYEGGQKSVEAFAQNHLPESLHPVVSKVIKAVPETLFCASMFTGMLKPLAFGVFAVKTAYVISPIVQKAINEGLSRDHMIEALDETQKRGDQILENMHPALLTSSAVGGALSVAIAISRFSPTMAMHGAFFGLLGVIAYKNMQAKSSI